MKEACVEEGMKLARWLHMLGLRGTGVATASYEEYQRLSKEAGEALSDVDKMTCLSNDERSVIKNELTYLKEQAEKVNFLYTSDAGARLLHLLSNPQFYTEYYKPILPVQREGEGEWVYAKVGKTEVRGKKVPTGIEIEKVSPTYDIGDFDRAVVIIEKAVTIPPKTLKLVIVKIPETGEYKVKWIENGIYSEAKSYYTDDHQDALDTLRAMENEGIRMGYKIVQ
uniref:Uncharacterized protein n=2 Tax=viral metagenome TaxID=1070528 RepID=A0A6M3M3R0_9ZZZZ